MRRTLFALVILLCGIASAQVQHTAPTKDSNDVITGSWQFTPGARFGPTLFAALPVGAADGVLTFCPDCSATVPCTGAGSGVLAVHTSGQWSCSAGGSSSGILLQVNAVDNAVQSKLNLVDSNGVSPVDNGDGSVEMDVQAASSGFASGCIPQLGGAAINVSLNCIPNASYNGTIGAISSNFVTPAGGFYTWLGSVNGQGKIQSQSAASNPILSWPTQSGTLAASATSPITLDPVTGAIGCATCATGVGGGNPAIENCTPDQTGNSFYTTGTLTNWFPAHWEFTTNTTTYINCEIYIPTAATGAKLLLDIFSNDATAGHTANFQTCDVQITTGTLQVAAPSCAANQAFTTTATAYQRVTLTYNVQSTLSNGGMLVVKIATSPTGTQPTSNMYVYPHFVL